jgi:hypothetical protein
MLYCSLRRHESQRRAVRVRPDLVRYKRTQAVRKDAICSALSLYKIGYVDQCMEYELFDTCFSKYSAVSDIVVVVGDSI